jgi:hypothetical protein
LPALFVSSLFGLVVSWLISAPDSLLNRLNRNGF